MGIKVTACIAGVVGLLAFNNASAQMLSAERNNAPVNASVQMLSVEGNNEPVKAVVGTCNSDKGCKALKRACLKAKGTYDDVDNGGDLKGTCNDNAASTPGVAVQASATFAADTGPAEDAFCYNKTFCGVLKQTCSNSGGTYTPIGKDKGVCKD